MTRVNTGLAIGTVLLAGLTVLGCKEGQEGREQAESTTQRTPAAPTQPAVGTSTNPPEEPPQAQAPADEPPPPESPGEHAHRAPHGGSTVTVGHYHYELVVRDRTFIVYLLDARMRTLPVTNVRGQLEVSHGQERNTLPLRPVGDHLEATGEHAEHGDLVATVRLELDGQMQSGRITHHPAGHHKKAGHAH